MSTQSTHYHADGAEAPVEVKTQSIPRQSSRSFDATHLDELERSLATKRVEIKPAPAISRALIHRRIVKGQPLEFPIDPRPGEDAAAFSARALSHLAKLALQNPGDV